jgi:hypothetical protein
LFSDGIDVRLLERKDELDDLGDLGVVRGFVEILESSGAPALRSTESRSAGDHSK